MLRTAMLRSLGASFALWFGVATGQYGLANECWVAAPPAADAHAAHHGPAPADGTVPAQHDDHGNCLTHCAGVLGGAPALTVPTLARVAPPVVVRVEPQVETLPGSPATHLPFANGPPPPHA